MSPQSVATKKGNDLIRFLIRHDFITFVVMDKIHLACSFGNTFRKEFGQIPYLLFSHLKDYCLMLFLTATCTSGIRRDFKLLMQLELNSWSWPSSNEMKHRCVSTDTKRDAFGPILVVSVTLFITFRIRGTRDGKLRL